MKRTSIDFANGSSIAVAASVSGSFRGRGLAFIDTARELDDGTLILEDAIAVHPDGKPTAAQAR